MEIVWLGHSCFRIKGKDISVVTDPFDSSLGYPQRKVAASVVTVSHAHPHHNFTGRVEGNPRVISRPGEYEISNVFITGVPTFHDAEKGALRGKNIVYLIDIDDVKICHLGDLGHVLTTNQIEEIGNVDILMLPVGGVTTITGPTAAEVIGQLEPKLVIPMHYKTDVADVELQSLDRFINEMGVKDAAPLPKLTFGKSTLPAEMKIVVLDYK